MAHLPPAHIRHRDDNIRHRVMLGVTFCARMARSQPEAEISVARRQRVAGWWGVRPTIPPREDKN